MIAREIPICMLKRGLEIEVVKCYDVDGIPMREYPSIFYFYGINIMLTFVSCVVCYNKLF